jgi:hypothetical protein
MLLALASAIEGGARARALAAATTLGAAARAPFL